MADPQFKAPIHIALSANTLVTHDNGATLHNRGMCSVYLIKGQIGGPGGGDTLWGAIINNIIKKFGVCGLVSIGGGEF